jgi:hypothetical protein
MRYGTALVAMVWLTVPADTLAQPAPAVNHVPRLELSVLGSVVDRIDEPASIGARVTRNLTKAIAIEGGLDVGRVANAGRFTTGVLQLKLTPSLQPFGRSPFFALVGVGAGISGSGALYPQQSVGLAVGFGWQLTVSDRFGIRFEVQKLPFRFGEDNFGVRGSLGVTVAFDK